ncbi:MAG: hypothetical protein ACJ73E_12100 [Mycobacteriales bacterium]
MILLSLVLVVASATFLGWGITTTSEQLVWASLLAGLAAVALVTGSVVRYRRRLAAAEATPATPPEATAATPPEAAPVTKAAPPAWWSGGSAAAAPGVPPAGAWPWSPDVTGAAGSPAGRSGWTGPVAPPPPPTGPGETAGQPAEQPDRAWPPATTEGAVEQAAATGHGAAPDRPLGEPFPEAPVDDGEPAVEDVPVRDALRVAQLDDDVQVVDGHPRYHLTGCPALAGAEPVPVPVSAARRAGFTPCAVCGPDRALLARARDRRPPAP